MAGYIPRRFTSPWAITHPSSNQIVACLHNDVPMSLGCRY